MSVSISIRMSRSTRFKHGGRDDGVGQCCARTCEAINFCVFSRALSRWLPRAMVLSKNFAVGIASKVQCKRAGLGGFGVVELADFFEVR